jgi:hypothetical protein
MRRPYTVETVSTADGSAWSVSGVTDGDGRAGNLLPTDHTLQPGHYCITFDCEVRMSPLYLVPSL